MFADFLNSPVAFYAPPWVWHILVITFMMWRGKKTWNIYRNRPQNMTVSGTTLKVEKWLSSFQYIIRASDMILNEYSKSDKKPFAIPSLSEYQVLVSSEDHVDELSEAPEDYLSSHEAMVDRLQHKYTMYGFEHNDVDPQNAIPVRTLKVLLRTNIPDLQPELQPKIESAFQKELDPKPFINGWRSVSAFSLARRITSQMNNHVLVGSALSGNEEYIEAAIRYNEDVVIAMELCRQIPSFLVCIVAPLIMGWSGAMNRVASFLRELIQARLQEISDSNGKPSIHMDCLQWTIECSRGKRQRSLTRLTQQTIAVLFASAHQMPMALVYAIYSLCLYPEFVESMREEAEHVLSEGFQFENMPLMDAFLRESARLNPLDALSIQRKATRTWTFADGTLIPKGNLVCVPQQAMMRDSANYNNPLEFDPTRYLVEEGGKLRAMPRFTDVKSTFPYWGSPKRACPARWYVSVALKQALAHFITTYEFKLEDKEAPRTFTWTTALVPRTGTNILLKERTIKL